MLMYHTTTLVKLLSVSQSVLHAESLAIGIMSGLEKVLITYLIITSDVISSIIGKVAQKVSTSDMLK